MEPKLATTGPRGECVVHSATTNGISLSNCHLLQYGAAERLVDGSQPVVGQTVQVNRFDIRQHEMTRDNMT